MNSYIGRHAELYDIFYGDKQYTEEASFVHQCLQRYGDKNIHRLLELACGTGSHSLALENMGYKIVASDYSKDMLTRAHYKASHFDSKIDFRWQDMRDINLPDPPFDAVICLFDSIGYAGTNEALIQILQGVNRHLRPNGMFVFEFWHAGAMLRNYEPLRVRHWSFPDKEILRISKTEINYVQQLAIVNYDVYELNKDGTYSNFKEKQMNRYFLVQEMACLLSICGFTPLKWFSGFTVDENITENTWHIIAIAQKHS